MEPLHVDVPRTKPETGPGTAPLTLPSSSITARADGPVGLPAPADRFLLLYNSPEDPGAGLAAGWTLTGWYGSGLQWSTPLDARGAGANAAPRVAQATAVRVLTEQGVAVRGWSLNGAEDVPAYWARLVAPVVPSPRTPPRASGRWAGLRRVRGS